MLEVGGALRFRLEAKSQKSEVRDQRSEVGGQRTDDRFTRHYGVSTGHFRIVDCGLRI